AGGKFYFAKDSVLRAEDVSRFLPANKLSAFKALKAELDPTGLLTTDLSQRLFPD
ncbi:MAG: FAD-binding protein, partial [Alcanivorax sp.]|nr:FAD-binding protein [Alcanivorax sp.]